ncbi:MAG: thymidine phosphorylase [Verrucomicrobia bacterium]|nr:thymidine phosphorylase [Verrucomicrobiota bacterium]
MVPQWLIEKKRDGLALSETEIRDFMTGYTNETIPDYQMAAMAMAIYLKGMTPQETATLVDVMMHSGDLVDTSSLPIPKADKHSTGGIGDKVSLILAPLAACMGVAVPMISGRGLGITGGTLDKLEAIPGYRTDLSEPDFLKVLAQCGCSIIGQTARLAPADKKLYALRDVTATVPSIPLITASIMCKKLAEGIDSLVLDVKFGKGAFMKTIEDARTLAQSMVDVGSAMKKKVSAFLTDMNQPLGATAGNAVEVIESVKTLQGEGPEDLTQLTVALTVEMIALSFPDRSREALEQEAYRLLRNGQAYDKFKEMVQLQGGDTACLDDPSRFPGTALQAEIPAPSNGTIAAIDAEKIGRAVILLGGGRAKTDDRIDHAVGITGIAKVGTQVQQGEPLMRLLANDQARLDQAVRELAGVAHLQNDPVQAPTLIHERITP